MKRLFLPTIIPLLLLTLFVSGCSTRMIDFTVISSKNMQLQIPQEARGERVEGRDEVWMLLSIPLGRPEIKEAVDQALENAGPGYDALIDGVLYQTVKFYGIVSKIGFKVEGTPINTSLLSTNAVPTLQPLSSPGDHTPFGNRPVLYHSSLEISNKAAIAHLKIRKNKKKDP